MITDFGEENVMKLKLKLKSILKILEMVIALSPSIDELFFFFFALFFVSLFCLLHGFVL